MNEGYVYHKLLDKGMKIKPKFEIQDIVRTEGLKWTFSKGDSTYWSHRFYELREIFIDTIPSYKIDISWKIFGSLTEKDRINNERKW